MEFKIKVFFVYNLHMAISRDNRGIDRQFTVKFTIKKKKEYFAIFN